MGDILLFPNVMLQFSAMLRVSVHTPELRSSFKVPPCYHGGMELDDAVTAVSLLLACWGLYLTRLQVFPQKKLHLYHDRGTGQL